MLHLTILGQRYWDEDNELFVYPESCTLVLEHSLVSLSKWEEKFEKPFLGRDEKSAEEILDYIIAMNLTPNTPPEVFNYLTEANMHEINDYINRKATATWFNELPSSRQKPNHEVITAELVYYWMVSFGMPMDPFQHWHLNRLFTQLKVFSVKNSKNEKMNRDEKKDWLAERERLNELRKQQYGTEG